MKKALLFLAGNALALIGLVLFFVAIGGYSEGTQTFSGLMFYLPIGAAAFFGGMKLTTI